MNLRSHKYSFRNTYLKVNIFIIASLLLLFYLNVSFFNLPKYIIYLLIHFLLFTMYY